jgi:hypothetical protein
VKCRFVAREAAFVLHPALDVVENDPWQLAPSDPMQIFDIDGSIEVHVPSSFSHVGNCKPLPTTPFRVGG